MKHELDTEDFRSSLAGWIPILTTAAPDTHPEKHLIDDWVHFVSEKEAGSIAALGISPSCLAEAIRHGFCPDDREPDALTVLRARATGQLAFPIERSTARQLSIALIDFGRKDHCGLVPSALRIAAQSHLSISDAVFLLKKSHTEQQIVSVLNQRSEPTPAEIHELIRFGSATREWTSLGVKPARRRLLQRAGITPDRHQAWAKLGVTDQDEILDAAQLWDPDEARNWMTALNVSHQNAAEWFRRGHDVRLARAWLALGFDAPEAAELEAHDVGPAQAKLWARLGVCSVGAIITHKAVWAPDELAKWDGWEPSDALTWTKFFDSPEHATPWQEIGLAADLAAELCNRGWLPEQAQHHTSQALEAALSFAAPEDSIEHALRRSELWRSLDTRDTWSAAVGVVARHDDLDDWYRSGLSLESVVFLQNNGQTPAAAMLLNEMNLTSISEQEAVVSQFGTPQGLAAWLDAGFTQETAARWKASGYSAKTAAEWTGVNATLDQANELSARGASPAAWKGYSELGIDLGTAGAMARTGLTPQKFLVWQNQLPGLSALDVLAWFGTEGSLHEVSAWQAQGLTPAQAANSQKGAGA